MPCYRGGRGHRRRPSGSRAATCRSQRRNDDDRCCGTSTGRTMIRTPGRSFMAITCSTVTGPWRMPLLILVWLFFVRCVSLAGLIVLRPCARDATSSDLYVALVTLAIAVFGFWHGFRNFPLPQIHRLRPQAPSGANPAAVRYGHGCSALGGCGVLCGEHHHGLCRPAYGGQHLRLSASLGSGAPRLPPMRYRVMDLGRSRSLWRGATRRAHLAGHCGFHDSAAGPEPDWGLQQYGSYGGDGVRRELGPVFPL